MSINDFYLKYVKQAYTTQKEMIHLPSTETK